MKTNNRSLININQLFISTLAFSYVITNNQTKLHVGPIVMSMSHGRAASFLLLLLFKLAKDREYFSHLTVWSAIRPECDDCDNLKVN